MTGSTASRRTAISGAELPSISSVGSQWKSAGRVRWGSGQDEGCWKMGSCDSLLVGFCWLPASRGPPGVDPRGRKDRAQSTHLPAQPSPAHLQAAP